MGYDVLGDDLEGYDVLGDMDVMGDDVEGARRSGRSRLQKAPWAQQLRAGAPGAPAISEMLLPLGLGSVTFVQGGPTTATLTASPQLAYRGERIVLSAVSGGGIQFIGIDGALSALSVSEYKVGQRSQLVSAGALPASAFGSFAFGVRTASDPCAPGIIITLGITYIGPALQAGETVTVSGVIFGRAAG